VGTSVQKSKILVLGENIHETLLTDDSITYAGFNREDLTHNCLRELLPKHASAGRGEPIVVDNGSSPQTASVPSQFSSLRVLRNEINHGFAVARNEGSRAAAVGISAFSTMTPLLRSRSGSSTCFHGSGRALESS
jgi:hypothetical protein